MTDRHFKIVLLGGSDWQREKKQTAETNPNFRCGIRTVFKQRDAYDRD